MWECVKKIINVLFRHGWPAQQESDRKNKEVMGNNKRKAWQQSTLPSENKEKKKKKNRSRRTGREKTGR